MDILHDEPADGLAILGVDARGLDKLGLKAVDRVRMVVCVKVDGDCVDHCRGWLFNLRWDWDPFRLTVCGGRCEYVCV